MGLLSSMDEEIDCIETIFQNYVTSKSKTDIFLFFEGKDDFKYYFSRILPFIEEKQKYNKYHCNCKNNVLEIHKMICEKTSDYRNHKLLYFVDCDYDENGNIPKDIYVTSAYSIENYYFTDSAIRNMLIGVVEFSKENVDDEKDLKNVSDYLIEKRNKVIDEIIYSNAWYALQIKKSKNISVIPNLIPLKEYKKINKINKLEDLESLAKNPIKVEDFEINEEIARLREKPMEKIRGKYFIQALTPIFKTVLQDAGRKKIVNFFQKREKLVLIYQIY